MIFVSSSEFSLAKLPLTYFSYIIFRDKKEYSVLIRVEACRVKMQTVISVIKNVFQVTWLGVKRVDNRLDTIVESIIISRLNIIIPIFLKDFLIVLFLNTYKQILVIWAKNSNFENS